VSGGVGIRHSAFVFSYQYPIPNAQCPINLQLPTIIHQQLSKIMFLKSTTRHVHIYAAQLEKNELIPSDNVLTLDVDPDNEFNWDDFTLQKVYRKFDDLVESSSGDDLNDYNLRRIGSDLEHFIRGLLLKGEISYNLNSRVLNYSMGLPRVESPESEGKYQIN
jgi:NAD(P)H-quinone oxidoreductase subunit M